MQKKTGAGVLLGLLGLAGCGAQEIAGTYVVKPVGSTDLCGGNCPQGNETVYTLVKITDTSYRIEVAGAPALVATLTDGNTLDWTYNGEPTADCTEQDKGHVTVGKGRLDGYLDIRLTCGAESCLCSYMLENAG